jgi:predicted amidophosphoribosyltransferase
MTPIRRLTSRSPDPDAHNLGALRLGALRSALLDALAVVAPTNCVGCAADDRALCAACALELRPRPTNGRLPDGTPLVTSLRYDGVVRRIVLAYKEEGRTDVARSLAAPLAAAIGCALSSVQPAAQQPAQSAPQQQPAVQQPIQQPIATATRSVQLCAVPTSRVAFRRRGYDPVRLLLRSAGLPRAADVLVPTRRHEKQKLLDRSAREQNLAGWLRARHPLSGQEFIVVDDVITTGSTLAEAVRAIRDGGGEVLSAVALASTPKLFGHFGFPVI